jgi:polar amino acid transport system substrate-binding protein
MRKTWNGPAALLACGALLVAGCGSESTGGDTATGSAGSAGAKAEITPPAQVAKAGSLTICSDMTFPPMEFLDGSTPKGVDVELGDDIAKRFGVTANFEQTGFDAIIAALNGKKCDVVMSAMTITPDRQKGADFVPYVEEGQAILVAKGNPKGIHSIDDMSGNTVAVPVGTSTKAAIDAYNKKLAADGRPQIKQVILPNDTAAMNALRTGSADSYLSDVSSIAYRAQQDPDKFEVASDEQFNVAPVGIAVRKGDTETKTAIQAAVDAAYADGTMAQILESWDLANVALKK